MNRFLPLMVGLICIALPPVHAQTQIGNNLVGTTTHKLGYAVSISADGMRMAASAPNKTTAYVNIYDFNTGTSEWDLTHTFTGAPEGDGFFWGFNISLSGDGQRIAIASPNSGTGPSYRRGQVVVYEDNAGVWSKVGSSFYGDGQYDELGYGVSLSHDGKRIILAARENSAGGYRKVYEESGGTWSPLGGTFFGPGATLQGTRCVISGDGTTIAIGDQFDDTNANNGGSVKVYKWDGSAWNPVGATFDGVADQYVGSDIDLSFDGSRLAIGYQFAGYVNVYSYDGTAWTVVGGNIPVLSGSALPSIALSASGKHIAISGSQQGGAAGRHGLYEETTPGNWQLLNSGISGLAATATFSVNWADITADGSKAVFGDDLQEGSKGIARVFAFSTSLPVSWRSFTAQAVSEGHHLQWETATEQNNSGFQVEHSRDGRSFRPIAWVEGAGTTTQAQSYEHLAPVTHAGTHYYRLKQLDYNGEWDYSAVVTVLQPTTHTAPHIAPNPFRDHINLYNATGGIATLFNALGQPVQQIEITHTPYLLDAQDLPQGHYTLHLQYADGHTHTQQLIK